MSSATVDAPVSATREAMPPEAVFFQLLFGKILTTTTAAIARLRVADHMEVGRLTHVHELARATGSHAPSLYRVMRMLSSFGVFHQDGERFSLTPVGEMLQSTSPRSMREMAMMFADPWITRAYQEMTHCIQTGGDGVTKAFGKNGFELFPEIPDQAATFHAAMTNLTRIVSAAAVEAYDFGRFRKMVDVAGGHGILLATILRSNPGLDGVLFDLPEVVSGAAATGHFEGMEDRVQFEAGSFFETMPGGADAYILKSIIHDWSDELCRKILGRIREQLVATNVRDGRVFVFEMIVPESPEPSPAKMLDIEMLVATVGGKERTEREFRALFASAGLHLERIVPTRSPLSLLEARVA